VLTPLAVAKHGIGAELGSLALKGDVTLSGICAGFGVIALLALLAERIAGWWWPDRVAALVAALVAGAEAARVLYRSLFPSSGVTSRIDSPSLDNAATSWSDSRWTMVRDGGGQVVDPRSGAKVRCCGTRALSGHLPDGVCDGRLVGLAVRSLPAAEDEVLDDYTA
jgi:hypothetical protein